MKNEPILHFDIKINALKLKFCTIANVQRIP